MFKLITFSFNNKFLLFLADRDGVLWTWSKLELRVEQKDQPVTLMLVDQLRRAVYILSLFKNGIWMKVEVAGNSTGGDEDGWSALRRCDLWPTWPRTWRNSNREWYLTSRNPYAEISSHRFWYTIYLSDILTYHLTTYLGHVYSLILSDILSGILSDIHSGIYSDILSGIYVDTLSAI